MKGFELLGLLAKAKKVRVSQYTDYKFTCPMGATFAELQFGVVQRWPNWQVCQKSDVYRFKVEALHVCVTKEDKVNGKPVICKHKILSFKGCTLAQLKNWLQTKEGYDEVRANLYQKGYTYKTQKL